APGPERPDGPDGPDRTHGAGAGVLNRRSSLYADEVDCGHSGPGGVRLPHGRERPAGGDRLRLAPRGWLTGALWRAVALLHRPGAGGGGRLRLWRRLPAVWLPLDTGRRARLHAADPCGAPLHRLAAAQLVVARLLPHRQRPGP